MAAILQHVGTPLQLAALFLLLLAGVARLLARSGKLGGAASAATTRLIVNRLFAAALVALVLGLLGPPLAPVLDRWLNGDETFRGVVLASNGDPVPGASVHLLSIALATTNPLGQFEIVVPRNRVAAHYRVQVKAPGYQTPDTVTRSDADLRQAEFRLTPAPSALVKDLAPRVFIGQYFGLPFVIATFRVENTTDAQQNITEVRATLRGPDGGGAITLQPASWTLLQAFGPYAPVVGPFPIAPGARLDLRVLLAPASTLGTLMARLNALPAYRTHPPCTPSPDGQPPKPLTDEAYRQVADFAQARFAWREGDWRLQLATTAGREERAFQRDLALGADDVARLRQSFPLIQRCLGVNLGAPLAQDGDLANFLEKGP